MLILDHQLKWSYPIGATVGTSGGFGACEDITPDICSGLFPTFMVASNAKVFY